MRQEQSLPRAIGRSFSPLSIARDTANQRSRAREPLAARGELRKVDDALRAARPRGASLEEAASRQALAQLAMASHDLRDPLQVIASHVELVADGFRGAISVEQRACLDDVRAQIDHLSAVVGSVLALARATQQGRALE
jgi:signal transduction histidine kinase